MYFCREAVYYFAQAFVDVALLRVFEIFKFDESWNEISVEKLDWFKLEALVLDSIHSGYDLLDRVEGGKSECIEAFFKTFSFYFHHFSQIESHYLLFPL